MQDVDQSPVGCKGNQGRENQRCIHLMEHDGRWKDTLPETQQQKSWKWMVGIRAGFLFGLVSGRVWGFSFVFQWPNSFQLLIWKISDYIFLFNTRLGIPQHHFSLSFTFCFFPTWCSLYRSKKFPTVSWEFPGHGGGHDAMVVSVLIAAVSSGALGYWLGRLGIAVGWIAPRMLQDGVGSMGLAYSPTFTIKKIYFIKINYRCRKLYHVWILWVSRGT